MSSKLRFVRNSLFIPSDCHRPKYVWVKGNQNLVRTRPSCSSCRPIIQQHLLVERREWGALDGALLRVLRPGRRAAPRTPGTAPKQPSGEQMAAGAPRHQPRLEGVQALLLARVGRAPPAPGLQRARRAPRLRRGGRRSTAAGAAGGRAVAMAAVVMAAVAMAAVVVAAVVVAATRSAHGWRGSLRAAASPAGRKLRPVERVERPLSLNFLQPSRRCARRRSGAQPKKRWRTCAAD